ncbi:MAG: hypothetical protein QM756_03485 [Polyangiaceae bacterium]
MLKFTQAPLHAVSGEAQAHAPEVHACPVEHVVVQVPQWALSFCRLTHAPLQLVNPVWQPFEPLPPEPPELLEGFPAEQLAIRSNPASKPKTEFAPRMGDAFVWQAPTRNWNRFQSINSSTFGALFASS